MIHVYSMDHSNGIYQYNFGHFTYMGVPDNSDEGKEIRREDPLLHE